MPNAQRPQLVVWQDSVFQVQESGSVFQFLGIGNGWKKIDANPDTRQVAVGGCGTYLYHGRGAVYAYLGAEFNWRKIDNSSDTKGIAVGAKFVYQFHTKEGRIYLYTGKQWSVLESDKQAIAIAIDHDSDTLYQIHGYGGVSVYLGSLGWKEIDRTPNVQSVVIGGGGRVYKLHKDGSIYVHKVEYDWDRIDSNPDNVQIAAGPAGLILRHSTGSVWRYDMANNKWDVVLNGDGQVIDIAVGNHFYAMRKDYTVVRFDGSNWVGLN